MGVVCVMDMTGWKLGILYGVIMRGAYLYFFARHLSCRTDGSPAIWGHFVRAFAVILGESVDVGSCKFCGSPPVLPDRRLAEMVGV